MTHSGRDSESARRRLDRALEALRRALGGYLAALPRTRPAAHDRHDLQRLLKLFIDRFPELPLERRVRTLVFAAKEARNEIAHYAGAMPPDRALLHLSNVRQLLEDLGTKEAFEEVDRLYQEQLDALRPREGTSKDTPAGGAVAPRTSLVEPLKEPQAKSPHTLPDTGGRRPGTARGGYRGKYAPLYRHLTARTGDEWPASFREVESILGFSLPDSARGHQAWWSNTETHSQAKAWLAAGWRTLDVNLAMERLSFARSRGRGREVRRSLAAAPPPSRNAGPAPPSPRPGADLSQADRIRSFAVAHFIEPARDAGRTTVTIRAGDVGRRMGLQQNMPNVCNALGGRKLEALADARLVDRSGPPVGANTVFTYSIGAGPPTASGTDRGLTSPPVAARRIRSGGTSAPRRRLDPRSPLGSTPRTVVVFPCAAAKARDAGRLRLPDGRRVSFVAKPSWAPANPSMVYRRPDDRAPDGTTFRDMLVEYNLHPGENPWGLLPAWRLYRPVVYGELAREPGIANLFILSAGWGLIKADFLTPDYDITWSANADRHKRRTRGDRYEDFRQLPVKDVDRVVFAGGKDYIPMFLSLTGDFDGERVVFFNSAVPPRARNARFVRFETDTKTNWHYEWARAWLDGKIELE